jgi:hypothetical protein
MGVAWEDMRKALKLKLVECGQKVRIWKNVVKGKRDKSSASLGSKQRCLFQSANVQMGARDNFAVLTD